MAMKMKNNRQYSDLQRIMVNTGLILLNVLVFSNAFAGVKILAGGALNAVFGFAVIVFSVFVFIKINIVGFLGLFGVIYSQKKSSEDIDTLDQCETALRACATNNDSGFFNEGIDAAVSQIVKFSQRKGKVKNALAELFEDTEITYKKFNATVDSAEAAIIGTIKILTEKLRIIDGSGYTEKRRALYDELAGQINETVRNFDEMNLKMDGLLLELTKYCESSNESIKQNDATAELQSLIDSVKWYKGSR